jgi:hypothetical protein
MIRKIMCCSALVPFFMLGVAVPARSQSTAPPAQAQAEQSKQVSGKITDIGSDRRSFSLEVNEKGSKHTMQFVVDNSTQVQGKVTTGTDVAVQYAPMSDGKLVARNVTAQNSQSGPGR